MNWNNLKYNKCPKCNGDFTFNLTAVGGMMIHNQCGFRIRESRYQEIVTSMNADDILDEGLEKEEVNAAGQEMF